MKVNVSDIHVFTTLCACPAFLVCLKNVYIFRGEKVGNLQVCISINTYMCDTISFASRHANVKMSQILRTIQEVMIVTLKLKDQVLTSPLIARVSSLSQPAGKRTETPRRAALVHQHSGLVWMSYLMN